MEDIIYDDDLLCRLFTDGACSGNPGEGGWAFVWLNKNAIVAADYGYEDYTTNNRMELKAILKALQFIYNHRKKGEHWLRITFEICSDSSYAVNSINEWMLKWVQNDWRRKDNILVDNLDLMKELYYYFYTLKLCEYVTIKKVQGHSGDLGNEICDAICSKNRKRYEKLLEKYNLNDCWQYALDDKKKGEFNNDNPII